MPPAEYSVLSRLPIPGTSRLPGFLPGHDSAELTGSVLWTDDRQKAALAYAEAITWHFDTGDAFWERLRSHFSEPELVELGLRGSPAAAVVTLAPALRAPALPTLAALAQIRPEAAMPLTSTDTRPGPATRRVGYAVAVAVNAALLVVLNALPGWQEFPFLTDATPQVLGLVNALLAVNLAVNLVYLASDPRWLKSLGDMVTAGFTLAVGIRTWQVFPFAFNGSWAWCGTAARVLLIVGLIGAGIAVAVQAVSLTLLASHAPLRHRPGTGH